MGQEFGGRGRYALGLCLIPGKALKHIEDIWPCAWLAIDWRDAYHLEKRFMRNVAFCTVLRIVNPSCVVGYLSTGGNGAYHLDKKIYENGGLVLYGIMCDAIQREGIQSDEGIPIVL